jgi:hypothetical protein
MSKFINKNVNKLYPLFQVRYNMVLNTMRTVRGWDLDTFLSIPPDQRDEIIKALNEDVNKLLAELDPNDPLARRLKVNKKANGHERLCNLGGNSFFG